MKKLIFLLSLLIVLGACEVNVQTDSTTAQTTENVSVETTADTAPTDVPYETVYLPVREGESYFARRFDDRYVVFFRYKEAGPSNNISVLDLKTCEFVYDAPLKDVNYSIFTHKYLDGKRVMVASEYDVDSCMIITEENGVFSHEVTTLDKLHPFTYEYFTSPDGKYATYETFDEGDGTINVKYPDGSVKQILRDDRSGDLASHRGYTPLEFIDNTRFVYHISGYEWTAGYGIYNVETGEKTEVLEGEYPYAFFDGGFFTTTEKDYIVQRIYKHDVSGTKTLLASREKTDGAFELKSDCYYFYEGSFWFEVQGNPEYIRYGGDEDEAVVYNADFGKELGKVTNLRGLNENMFVYGEKIVIVQPEVVKLTPEEIKERDAKMLAEHIVEYAIAYDLDVCSYSFSGQDLFSLYLSLCLYDENAEHPYSDMISLSDDGTFFEISLEDARFINLHTFRINNFESTDYYKELLDINEGCFRIPCGVGVRRSSFACIDTETRTENGQIIVEFNLVDGYSGFEDTEHKDFGRCYISFSADDLVLLDFGLIENKVKETPYVISEMGYWGSIVKYEFASDGGMVVTYSNDTEEYYNSDGLLYKSMVYDETGKFTAKRFHTYDENGLIAKTEEYNAEGELTLKRTYVEGKPLYFETPDLWKKWEYNEEGLLIKESFATTAEVRYTDGVTEYTYDEKGRLIREHEINNEGQRGYEHAYDENGNMVLTKRISYDGALFDYIICSYYPDGTLQSKKVLPDGISYEIHFYEYLPDGTLWCVSEIWNPDIEAAGEYETVDTYFFYDDGRIKGATIEKYDLASGKYIKEHETSVSYSTDGRVRTDTHYHIDENGYMAFACELMLVYDKNGNLVSCETVLGDRNSLVYPFGNNENFFYYPNKYLYDEYGRVTLITRDSMIAESYEYMDCTPEQYELYQKVVE